MTYWVAEKSYNKVTTGKWHGNEPRPKGAPKPKPKPTLVKSRVRPRPRDAHSARRCCACAVAGGALSGRDRALRRSTTRFAEPALWTTRTTRSRASRRQRLRCVVCVQCSHTVCCSRSSRDSLRCCAQAMVAKEAPAGDAFEGMTPEEINEYLTREKAERQAQVEAEEAEARTN